MKTNGFPVTVVMITKDRRRQVLRALHEISRLEEAPHVIVVDNGSSDGTAAAIAHSFPAVEVVRSSVNLGAAARNLGCELAQSAYIAFCDDDLWWQSGCLRYAADLLDANPQLAVINPRYLVGESCREAPMCKALAASPLPIEQSCPGPRILGFVAGGSIVRRSAFMEVGGFHRRIFFGGEEQLLAFDLANNGWRLCYVPEVVAYHHPLNIRKRQTRKWLLVRNQLWTTWLRRPLGTALRHTVRATLDASRSLTVLRAIVAAAAGIPWILNERRMNRPEVERDAVLVQPESTRWL